jgi:uncharacterized membrane protein
MLGLATTAFTIALIYVNLLALSIVALRWTGSYALARVVAPAAIALAAFFVEHFVGFGRLGWTWPLLTVAAGWIVVTRRSVVLDHLGTEALFFLAFAWALAWRISFPGIVASSEKIGDLAMIVSYMPGSRLPPTDAWYPPYPFDIYYSFQQYGAALLGRLFALPAGTAYNLAFALVIALTITAAGAAAYAICRSVRGTCLVVAAFAIGGTGATLPTHFMFETPEIHSSMRFIGDAARPQLVDTAFGQWLVERAQVPRDEVIKLPSETFAYLTYLGDYHPPLSGFYLLMLALLCMALVDAGVAAGQAQAVLAATLPVCAIANGWTLPLQALLIVTWVAYRSLTKRPLEWRMLAAGLLVASALSYPFLSTFAYRSADYNITLKLVQPGAHVPWLLGSIVLYPTFIAILLPLLFEDEHPWLLWLSPLWLSLFLFSEVFVVNDIYSGIFDRFNTTLKWWPWIQAGALLVTGAHGLRATSRAYRYGTILVLLSVCVFGVDLARALAAPKPEFARLTGDGAITSDNIEKVILEYLKAQPPSVVLQRPAAGAFTPAPALTLFAGQQAFLGWAAHERLWRGGRADVDLREAQVKRFYAGELPDSAQWLLQNDIDFVLWLKAEHELPAGTFARIDEHIRSAYYWHELYRADEFRVGFWSRRVAPGELQRGPSAP